MTVKPFLVVIDTTEATMRQSVGLGILNVHVILAEDATIAKQTFLRVFSDFVRRQIYNSIYVYDLEHMTDALKNLPADRLPLFSFLPLAGGRPPKQADGVPVTLGNTTIKPNVNQERAPVQQPAQTQRPVQQQIRLPSSHNPRSKEFQNADANADRSTPNTLSADKAELVRRLGVTPTPEGTNEGTNLRVNNSVGKNVSLSQVRPQDLTSNTLTTEQAELLRKLEKSHTGPEIIPENVQSEENEAAALIDESLAQVDGPVLSEEEIAKLKSEVEGA